MSELKNEVAKTVNGIAYLATSFSAESLGERMRIYNILKQAEKEIMEDGQP